MFSQQEGGHSADSKDWVELSDTSNELTKLFSKRDVLCSFAYQQNQTVFSFPFYFYLDLRVEFSLFSYNNGMVMSSCRELDNNRSAVSATSAFAIATAGANEGTPTKEKYRRMSLASTGTSIYSLFH